MPSPRTALFATLVVLVGLAAVLLSRVEPPSAEPRPEDAIVRDVPVARIEARPEDRAAAIELAGPQRESVEAAAEPGSGETTVIYPLEVDVSLVLPGSVAVPDGVMPIRSGSNATIRGTITGANGSPASATLLFLYGPNEGRTLRTDSRGRFGASDLLQGISVVRVTTPGGLTAEREVNLAQLSTTPFNVSFANASFVSGTIQDDRGAALEAAEVRLDGRLAYTDAEGTFTFSGVPAGKVLVTARKDGYATTRRSVGVGFRSRVKAKDFVIGLGRSATLEIGLARTLGSPDPAIAFLKPTGGQRDFPWYEVNPVKIPQGGRAVVPGLPDGSVEVRVFHRGAVATPRSKSVRLYAGRSSTAMIELAPAPMLRGRVMDGGEVVANASVVIEAADRNTVTSKALGQRTPRFSLEMVVPPLPAAMQTTRTDKRGEFVFTSHPDIPASYYVTATSRDGKRRGVGVLPAGGKEVVVRLGPAESDVGTLQIELPNRFQGLPVEVRIQGAPTEPFVLRPGIPLEIEDLEQGTWRVRARWRGIDVVPGRVVEVSDAPAVVTGELPPGALQGQTEDERRRARGS